MRLDSVDLGQMKERLWVSEGSKGRLAMPAHPHW